MNDRGMGVVRRYAGLPLHGWLGLGLVAVCWPLDWLLPGMRTMFLFFPLWLGYILTVDALVWCCRRSSLLTRSLARGGLGSFAMLFVLSAVAWWLFEFVNYRTQNWHYLGREEIPDLVYAVLASLAFSTVIPAVFESAALVRNLPWVERMGRGPRIGPSRRTRLILLASGVVMFTLVMSWPAYFYPLVWGSAYCILEPVNAWLGKRTLLDDLRSGDWRPVVALGLGALLCGFFWEMWNYYSYPKWVYHTPGVEFLYVFEMPLLGFIGYIPFALELYALYHLLRWRAFEVDLSSTKRPPVRVGARRARD
ncbi:MAG TPA: hypothetical protein VF171_09520 [Trueperaceae bacterium]